MHMRFGLLALFFILQGCSHANMSSTYYPKAQGSKSSVSHIAPIPRENAWTIVIDPGHGGSDLGRHDTQLEEKALNLKTALMVRNELARRGYKVVMTRGRDVAVPLEQRAALANRVRADLFVSIHYNAAPQPTAEGIEVFYYAKAESKRRAASKKLATMALDKLIRATGAVSRGVKDGNYCVIRQTEMPAILIEGGFMTHQKESQKITELAYQKKIALAIAEAIDIYAKEQIPQLRFGSPFIP